MKRTSLQTLVLATILGMVSTAGGQTRWTTPVLIDTAGSAPPFYGGGEMALDDSGDIYTTFTAPSSESILVARSTDGGDGWIKHGYVDAPESHRLPQDIAIDHLGNVWLLWLSTYGGDFDPYYLNLSKSSDNGRTFTTLFRSFAWGNGFFSEKLAVDGQNSIYMLWDDQRVKLTKFRYGDVLKRTDIQIPNDTMMFGSNTCLMVSKDGVIHCIWEGIYFDTANNAHEYAFYTRSNDTGKTFQGRLRADTTTSISPYCDCSDYPSLAVDSAGTVFVSYSKNGQIRIQRSTNQGQSFNPPLVISGTDTAYDSKICVDSRQGVNILWGSVGHGIRHYRSTDGGSAFTPFAPFVRIGDSGFKAGRNGFLYVTGPNDTGFGFARTNVVLSVSGETPFPNTFALFQNYPNPFNPSTTIRFSIDHMETVDLRIYDIMGREIAALIQERLAQGTYSVRWDAPNFNSGAYFVRLRGEGKEVTTRKVILLR